MPVLFGLVFPKRSCYPSVLRSSRAWVGAQYTPVRPQRNSCVSKLVLTAPPLCDGSLCITLLSHILHAWNEASNVYLPTARLHRTNYCYSMGTGNQEEIPLQKLIGMGASECREIREAWGRSSYSTKQMILLWEQHEYGNHATDALCWTSNRCKLFWSSFWCIFSIHGWVCAEHPMEKLLLGRVAVAYRGWDHAGCDVLMVPRAVGGP